MIKHATQDLPQADNVGVHALNILDLGLHLLPLLVAAVLNSLQRAELQEEQP